jgi:hypothetical protein
MTSKCVATLLAAVIVGSVTVSAVAAQSPAKPETVPAAKSLKWDAYQVFRNSTSDALKVFATDKAKSLAAAEGALKGWETEFRPTATPEVVKRVENAFVALKSSIAGTDLSQFHIPRQIIDKSMLGQVIPQVEASLKAKKSDEAMAWFQVYAQRWDFEKTPNDVVAPVKAALAAPDAAKIEVAVLAMRRFLAGESISEVSEAPENVEKKNPTRALTVTTEGRTYFLGFRADFDKRVGKAEGDALLKAYNSVLDATRAGDLATVKKGFEQVKDTLTKYQALLTKAMAAATKG